MHTSLGEVALMPERSCRVVVQGNGSSKAITLNSQSALIIYTEASSLRNVASQINKRVLTVDCMRELSVSSLVSRMESLMTLKETVDVVLVNNISLFYWEVRKFGTTSATYTAVDRLLIMLTRQYGVNVIITSLDSRFEVGWHGPGECRVPVVASDVTRLPPQFISSFDRVLHCNSVNEIFELKEGRWRKTAC
ncbi:hypothetical protein DICA3_C21132 [Diutina catenulata]